MKHRASWLAKSGKLAFIALASAALAACGISPEQDRAAIEKGILSTPGAEELWQTIKDEYPDEFDDLLDRVQALNTSERLDRSKPEAIGAQWLQEFFTQIGADAVKAPAAELIAWAKVEHEMYVALQSSAVAQCGQMAMGQWIFIREDNEVAQSAIAKRNAAMVRAAAAGKATPQI